MKRVIVTLMITFAALVIVPHVAAQSPAPVSTPAADSSTEPGPHRPWGRLYVFVPVAIVVGAGAVYARRQARNRGWTAD